MKVENGTIAGKWIKYPCPLDWEIECDLEKMYREDTKWDINSLHNHIYIDYLYIYYTKDAQGEYTKPKIKFELSNSCISYLEGIGKYNMVGLDDIDALQLQLKKLNLYNEKSKKSIYDLKTLYNIEFKHHNKIELSKEEIIFLYNINYYLDNFSDKTSIDQLAKDIRNERDAKEDLSKIFECQKEEIGTKLEDFIHYQVKVYYGNIVDYSISDLSRLRWLKVILGNGSFNYTHSTFNLSNLEFVYGNLSFAQLDKDSQLNIRYVKNMLCLYCIEDYERASRLEYVGHGLEIYNYDKRGEENQNNLVKTLYK